MKYQLYILLMMLGVYSASAQPDAGLIGYYPFDDCTANDASPDLIGGNGTVVGNPNCSCGVLGDAMEFDGIDDHVTFNGNVNAVFESNDFTVSFYFKPFDAASTQNILSKRVDCTGNGAVFNVDYLPSLNFINAEINETATKRIAISSNLDLTCWHHFAVTRDNNRVKMYLNGVLVDEKVTSTVLDLSNSSLFSIANTPCLGSSSERFRGKLDELRVYNRALTDDDIAALYVAPDKIAKSEEIIYLGQSVDAEIPYTCANNFSWTPTTNVDNPTTANPVITPTETTTYEVSVLDDYGCTTTDTVRIIVIDPADLDCKGIFLPKAFTPNGDGLNEDYGISNPLAVQQLVEFSIYDRLGSRVFTTSNPSERWDGTFKGRLLNGGVFLYKLTYICEGEQLSLNGTVTLMR